MPSKGIDLHTYISPTTASISLTLTTPSLTLTLIPSQTPTTTSLEIDKKDLGALHAHGRFSFTITRSDLILTTQYVDINALTGNLRAGTMNTMDQTTSIIADGVAISYGFYDAGPGFAGLPRQHQCYVCVTRELGDWMRELVPPGSHIADRMFSKMVLPAAHDVGMNSMGSVTTLLKNAGTGVIRDVLGREIPHVFGFLNKLGDAAIRRIAPDIIRALAVTQKDTLRTILALGARYFEFRPARCHSRLQRVGGLEDALYFQHGAIPGMPYRQFLVDVVEFLQQHGDEIVVVQLRWDGVPGECPRPSDDELREVLDEAVKGKELEVGNEADMLGKSIYELRDEKKRLILLQNANQVSNYDDVANATLDGDSMIEKLTAMAENLPEGHAIMVLQCQATATNIRDVVVASVVDADVSTSPILATKPICDAKILPLLRGDLGKKLVSGEGLVVFMNDFFDGATADVAINMCRDRLG
jgi:hypothetical protein